MSRNYYKDELNYLHEAGKEFAKAHPDEARYLNIDSVSDRDPSVERLFEGFAFLTGRIREHLDDELPVLTEALFNLLWPHFLKPIPSLAILEFKPKPDLVQRTIPLPVGTEVCSRPVGEEGAICRFRTTQEVRLQPFQLFDVAHNWPPGGMSNIVLRFRLPKGIELGKLQLSPLRLFFHATPSTASVMHLFFSRHVHSIRVSSGAGQGEAVELKGQRWVQPGGLSKNEAICIPLVVENGEFRRMLEYSAYSFSGYGLLQEYLTFRPKFWFVDLLGLDQFRATASTSEFDVQISFNRSYPEEKRFKKDNVRLFCSPIVNLFGADAEPITFDHLSSEYIVIPDVSQRRSVKVYSVDFVEGKEATGVRRRYFPFFNFNHDSGKQERYFTATTRLGETGQHETYIEPGAFHTQISSLPVETLSLSITCTNGSLPHEELQEGMITEPASDFSNVASFENLTKPTLDLQSPGLKQVGSRERQQDFFWKLMSHLAFNFMSAARLESLRGLLELYDWTEPNVNQLRIDGLLKVTWEPKEIIRGRGVMRGAEVTIEVQDGNFADEGDLCLFGLIMSEFFSMYATINSLVHLKLISIPSGQTYRWEPEKGALPVL